MKVIPETRERIKFDIYVFISLLYDPCLFFMLELRQ